MGLEAVPRVTTALADGWITACEEPWGQRALETPLIPDHQAAK